MYKNALDLYERLNKAANTYNDRNKLPPHFGAKVSGDSFSITQPQLHTLTIPVPGKTNDDYQALVNHDVVRITHKNTQISLASIELDLEYHTFKGFCVNAGLLIAAFKYTLPKKYDTVTHAPLTQKMWEELAKENNYG